MKVVSIIPIKQKSERVKGKNFKTISKLPLYAYFLNKLDRSNFDEIYIDTDSDEIKEYAKQKNFFVIDRLPELASNESNGNDLLNYHAKIITSDLLYRPYLWMICAY